MLDKFFGSSSSPQWFHLWHRRTKKTYWFQNTRDAMDTAEQLHDDVYFCATLAAHRGEENRRITAGGAVGLVAVSLDVDCVRTGLKELKPRCPDKDTARRWVFKELPAPSIIVDSGYGLQPWWLIAGGPWVWDTEAGLSRAKNLVHSWVAHAQCIAPWAIDSTGDLPRLMRVPGTVNTKADLQRSVMVVYESDAEYSVDLLESICQAIPINVSNLDPATVGGLTFDPAANPPAMKIAMMQEINNKFRSTLLGTRKDLRDPSQSGYDLALASMCVHAEWEDQEIVNLIISVRRERGINPEKALRSDYMNRLLATARKSTSEKVDHVAAAELVRVDEIVKTEDAKDRKNQVIGELRDKLKIPIDALVKYGEEEPLYSIRMESGDEIHVGSSKQLLGQNAMRSIVFDQTGEVVAPMKPKVWWGLVSLFQYVTVTAEMPDDPFARQIEEAVELHIKDTVAGDSYKIAVVESGPFYMNGQPYVNISAFTSFLQDSRRIHTNPKQVRATLARLGFHHEKIQVWHNGKNHTRSYWVGPKTGASLSIVDPPIVGK